MKFTFFLLTLILFTSEQNFNQNNLNINQNVQNIQRNQNLQNIHNQYENFGQYINNPQNNQYIQNQHNTNQFNNQYWQKQQIGNAPQFPNYQQNQHLNQQQINNNNANFLNSNYNINNQKNQNGNIPPFNNIQSRNNQQYQNAQNIKNQPSHFSQINQQNQQYYQNHQANPDKQYGNVKQNVKEKNLNQTNIFNQGQAISNNINKIEENKKLEKKNEKRKINEEIYKPKNIPFPNNFSSIFEPKTNNLSKHYEDCNDENIFCRSGLICKYFRCLTKFESKKSKLLSLKEKNICEDDDDCPPELECIKHRCVDDEDEVDLSKRNEDGDPSINLLFAGSIFLNNRAYDSGCNPDGSFNYDHLFQYIKDDIKKSDLAIVGQETVFETEKKNFVKKVSNTPSELGDAIAKAGFKVVLHGSLYAFAKEEKGIKNTLNFWNEKYPDIKILGISKSLKNAKDDYFIFKKNTIKIGLINFYGYNEDLIPKKKQFYVNKLKKEKLKSFVKKLSSETDFVIVCINWGNKNSNKPHKNQIKIAKQLTKNGAKLIIGYHPSIVQPTSNIKSKGKRALVFWSLGHLVSDSKKKYSILGALANITITKSENKAYISEYNLIPIINHKDKGKYYSVYKLSQYSEILSKHINKSINNCTRNDIVKKCRVVMGGLADCY